MDERVLRRIGRLVRVSEEAPRKAIAGTLVVLHQLRERRSVPVRGPCDDSRFVWKRLRTGASGRRREVGHWLPIMTAALAGVAESVDASVSNTDECKLVWVRVPPP